MLFSSFFLNYMEENLILTPNLRTNPLTLSIFKLQNYCHPRGSCGISSIDGSFFSTNDKLRLSFYCVTLGWTKCSLCCQILPVEVTTTQRGKLFESNAAKCSPTTCPLLLTSLMWLKGKTASRHCWKKYCR